MRKRGMTLIEVVTAVAVMGTGMGLFYTTFVLNWKGFDDQLVRVNLWQDANTVTQLLTSDGMASRQLNVTTDQNNQTATFTLPDGTNVAYSMTSKGAFQMQKNNTTTTLLQNVDFNSSSFEKTETSLKFTLTLWDSAYGKQVSVTTASQVFPRCAGCS